MLPRRGYLRLQYIQDLNGLAVGDPINVEIARRIVRDAKFIPVVLGAEVNCMTWAAQGGAPHGADARRWVYISRLFSAARGYEVDHCVHWVGHDRSAPEAGWQAMVGTYRLVHRLACGSERTCFTISLIWRGGPPPRAAPNLL